MNTLDLSETKYPDCLRNIADLQLGIIYLRHLGRDTFPPLLTIYEIEKPAILTYTEITKILKELRNSNLSDFAVKGLFSLAIAYFETMISDLMKTQLQFFPQKITSIKAQNGENSKEGKEITISQLMINKGSIIEAIIEKEVQKLSYKDIKNLLSAFCNVMSIKLKIATDNIDNLIEIKETRNLLLLIIYM